MSFLAPAAFLSAPADLLVVLVLVLLFFAPKRLPGLGRSIGSGIREFKDGITGRSGSEKDPSDEITTTHGSDESRSAG
jgi:sec-independent protein translocase protein TatA